MSIVQNEYIRHCTKFITLIEEAKYRHNSIIMINCNLLLVTRSLIKVGITLSELKGLWKNIYQANKKIYQN